jgi:iron(III) transport system substrate-binding protein
MSWRLSRRELIRRGALTAAGAGLGGLLSACEARSAVSPAGARSAPAAPAASGWEAVVARAQQEASVVLYDGHGGALPTIGYAAEQFTDDVQVRVDVSTMRASEALERVRVEQRAGQGVADVVTVGPTMVLQMQQDDLLQPVGELPNLARVSPEVMARVEALGTELREYAVWEALQFYGILVNTRTVASGDVPRSWRELTDPKWQGRIIMDDPRALGGGNYFFAVSLKAFGREYQQALAAKQPVLTRNIADAANRVARGEFALMVPFAFGLFAQIKDLPTVKVIIPEEGAIFALHGIAIPKAIRHPNAARVFVDYLLSDKVQRHLAMNYLRPAVSGAIEAAPPEVRDLLNAKLWGTLDDLARVPEIIATAQEIYP